MTKLEIIVMETAANIGKSAKRKTHSIVSSPQACLIDHSGINDALKRDVIIAGERSRRCVVAEDSSQTQSRDIPICINRTAQNTTRARYCDAHDNVDGADILLDLELPVKKLIRGALVHS